MSGSNRRSVTLFSRLTRGALGKTISLVLAGLIVLSGQSLALAEELAPPEETATATPSEEPTSSSDPEPAPAPSEEPEATPVEEPTASEPAPSEEPASEGVVLPEEPVETTPVAPEPRDPFIVTFTPGTSDDDHATALASADAVTTSSIPQLRMYAADLTENGVSALRADASVARVEIDKVREVEATPDDPSYDGQWALPKIGWDTVYGSVEPSGSATVAVLDTGVDATADLAGNLVGGASMLESTPGTGDPNGHGTAMAGIVAASTGNGTGIAGVGYAGVSVMPVKVLDETGLGQDSDIVEGVVWATDNGADVILMSFSNPGYSHALQAAVDYAWSNGVVLVAATGNDGSSAATYPAGTAKVVGVSATNRDDAPWSGSNYGAATFLGAPGVDIATGSGSVTGTSASAAIVAGSAALLAANDGWASNGVIVGRLARNADPAGTVEETGNGRVNLARALADDSTEEVVPAGVAGAGGPVVGPYVAAGNRNVSITVRDSASNDPLPGVSVECTQGCNQDDSGTTNSLGVAAFAVNYTNNSATVTLTASKPGYTSSVLQLFVANGANATPDPTLGSMTLTANNAAPLAQGQSVSTDEDTARVVTLSGTDADGNNLSFSVVAGPAQGSLGTLGSPVCSVSGGQSTCTSTVTYTPVADYHGSDAFTFKVNDGTVDSASATVSLTVNSVNDAPVLDLIGDKSGPELVELAFTASATDGDLPANTLSFSLVGPAHGASLNAGSGEFTWTPTEAQGPGEYTFTVLVSDGALTDEETFTVTVDEVNTAPVLMAIGDKSGPELVELAFTASATDGDLPANTLSFSLVGPAHGASLNAGSGEFTWTPTEAQGPGEYTFTVLVSDGALTDEETFTVTVDEVNTAPVLMAIGDKSGPELVELAFTASATDGDLPANTLSFSLVGPAHGASLNAGSGEFTWTPTEAQGPGEYTFTVLVSDGALTDEETFTVTVDEVNTAPVLMAIGDKSGPELVELAFTASATDGDLPANTLSFSLVGPAHGASLNAGSGEFTWTPTEAQGPGEYTFTVLVSDGALTDEETFTVTVDEVNTAPVLMAIGDKSGPELVELAFTASATDGDLPANTLSFSLVGPAHGASLNAGSGEFTWTPTEAQGPGEYTFTVLVSDGALTDEETFTVTVDEVNTAPVLMAIGDKSGPELVELAFTASATDGDLPANTLSFSLVGPAHGASLNAGSGEFTWTPTEAQGPGEYTFTVLVSDGALTDEETFTVTVDEVNTAPVLMAIGDKSGPELVELAFTASATDGDLPANTLSFSLVGPAHGASLNAGSGEFTWTPTEAQGPGEYTFTVLVSDGALTDEETFTVTVDEVNTAPVLMAIGDKSGPELVELAFTASATDGDLPANTLSFSLVGPAHGASLNAGSGEFTWTPTEAQGPGEYTFTVLVSDGALTDEETFTVTVDEVNTAPVLMAIGDKSGPELVELAFTASATDGDLPANTLSFSLVGPAHGASLNAGSGEFTWTPTEAQGPGEYTFTVLVSDGALTDEETFTVTVDEVNTAPVLMAIGDKSGPELVELAFTASATDGDLPANTLSFSLVGPAHGASLNAGSGEFTWTPTEAQGPGEYTFTVLVSDGALTDEETFTVTVDEVNTAPVLMAIGDKSGPELVELAFTASATDGDLPANTLSFSLVGPAHGASLNAGSGEFTWTPTEAQGPGEYTFTVLVSDGALTDEETFTVTVDEVNTAPVLMAIGDKSGPELVELAFTASATDGDLPANTLSFSLVGPAHGASLNAGSGEFTWTPTEAQGPGEYTFTVLVSDGALTDEETFTVTVDEVNTAPVLMAIGDKSGPELVELAFTASATDGDLPANTLSFSLVGPAHGASLNAGSGEFTWTPTEAQGPGEYTFTVLVSDGALTDEETFTVTVDEVNTAPVLMAIGDKSGPELVELAFTASATDGDLPANTLSFSLVGPAHGASLNAGSGEFTWTPTEAQGPGEYTFTVLVSDGALTDEETFTVTVDEVNTAPVLMAIGDKSGPELVELAFTASATDGDLPANTLSFSLVGPAHGASLNAGSGEFTWTPTEAQGPGEYTFTVLVSDGALTDEETFTVTVDEVNTAPVGADNTVTVDEDGVHVFGADEFGFSDPNDSPANALATVKITLLPGAGSLELDGDPVAVGDEVSVTELGDGLLIFTPAADANGDDYASFDFKVRDNGGTANGGVDLAVVANTITIDVTSVNDAPVVTSDGSPDAVDEGSSVSVSATFTDVDLGDSHTATIDWGSGPVSATIVENTVSGSHTYMDDSPVGGYEVEITVTDNGTTAAEPDAKSGSAIVMVDVNNVDPTVNDVEMLDLDPATGIATLKATFEDPGADEFTGGFAVTYELAGQDEPVTTLVGSPTISGPGPHSESSPGVMTQQITLPRGCFTYTVTATIEDDDDGSGMRTEQLHSTDTYQVSFRDPIRNSELNLAKYGQVVPVKVSMTSACSGAAITDRQLYLTIAEGDQTGVEFDSTPNVVAESVSSADTDNRMRIAGDMHIYNLNTKTMKVNTKYTLRVRVGASDGPIILRALFQPKK